MKRIPAVIALTAALSFGVSAHAQTSFADVPAGHWAQEAIARAVDCGIILGYPDGTFRGKQAITRYEAAAMIGRLLEAVAEGKCGLTGSGAPVEMDTAAMEALQNAVQELSADLADQGVRISELEDNAVSQDDLSRVEELATEARDLAEAAAGIEPGAAGVSEEDFAALQDQVASVEELAQEARDLAEANSGGGEVTDNGYDPEAFAALVDQVEAAGIASDTALAQSRDLQDSVDALNGRVDDLESQLGELGATVEGQADSIAALNDLVVLLNEDVLSLQDRVSALEGQIEDVNAQFEDINAQLEQVASADDLEALREFTTLLRRDQTALADRVSDLEARVGATEKKNADQDARLDVLEANGFTISGSIGLSYYVARTWKDKGGAAPDFDIDRLGLANNFSSGQDGDKNNPVTAYADFNNGLTLVNGTNQVAAGANIDRPGVINPSFSLSLAFKQRNLTEASKGYQSFPLTITITADSSPVTTDSFIIDGGSSIPDVTFKLSSFSAKYLVGASPLTINFGINPGWSFAKYVGSNGDGRGNGFVATADAGFLGLKLTGVYGSTSDKGKLVDSLTLHKFFRGVKGEASVLPGLSGGVYFLQEDLDIVTANATSGITAYGLTGSGKLFGFLDLEGEYSVSDGTADLAAGYVNASVNLGAFSIKGNYRTVDAGWGAGPSLGVDGNYPYKPNQNGFGVGVSIAGLFNFLNLSANYDSRSSKNIGSAMGNGPLSDTNAASTTETDISVVGGIRLIGFNIEGLFISEDESDAAGDGTVFGARAVHDGGKADALLKNVNLALGYGQGTGRYAGNGFFAYGDTALDLGGFSIKPKAYFLSGSEGTPTAAVNSLGFGLDVGATLFGAKLSGGVAFDNSSKGTLSGSTLWYSVGLAFDTFLLPNSSFSVAYASRTDVNRNGTKFGPTFSTFTGNNPVSVFSGVYNGWGDLATGSGQVESGLLFNFGYYGLDFKYGIFSNDPGAAGGGDQYWGNAFSITYKLKF